MNALDCSDNRRHPQAVTARCYQSFSGGFCAGCPRLRPPRALSRLVAAAALALIVLPIGWIDPAPVAHAEPPLPQITKARISHNGRLTTFSVSLSQPASPHVFTLAHPYRVIIDLPSVKFVLKEAARGAGLVKNYRYGAFAPGKSRIVLDVTKPVVVRKTLVKSARALGAWTFSLAIEETDEIGFLLKRRQSAAKSRAAASSNSKQSSRRRTRKWRASATNANSLPVIVIDAGHGGIDPGTIGARKSREKDVTMAVARRLRSILRRKKRYIVEMTRKRDTFISLDDRVDFSAKHGASLFISIHADAIGNKALARKVRGATVYTLSERASDDQARQLAAKENSADALAGIDVQDGRKGAQVKTILIDLLKRETSNLSTNFSNLLLNRFKGRIPLHGKKTKAAAFHVLKQTRTPSVLIELGYMSNRRDEKRLNSIRWQKKIAGAIAVAIDQFFAKKVAERR